MQQIRATISTLSLSDGIESMLSKKQELIQLLETTDGLGSILKKSFDPVTHCYKLLPTDPPLLGVCKALINLVDLINAAPAVMQLLSIAYKGQTDVLETLQIAFKNRQDMQTALNTLKSTATSYQEYSSALAFYHHHISKDFLQLEPRFALLYQHMTALWQPFQQLKPWLSAAFTTTSVNAQTPAQPNELDQLTQKVARQQAPTKSASPRFFAATVTAKQQLQADVLQWFHTADNERRRYYLSTTMIDEKLAALTGSSLHHANPSWYLASAQLSLEEKKNAQQQLIAITQWIAHQPLTYASPITDITHLRRQLTTITAFDIQPYLQAIDHCLAKKTGLHALNKKILATENKLKLLLCGIIDHPPEKKIQALMQLEQYRADLQKIITNLQQGSSVIYFYDKTKNRLHLGDIHHSDQPIATEAIKTKTVQALAALMDANLTAQQALQQEIDTLKQQSSVITANTDHIKSLMERPSTAPPATTLSAQQTLLRNRESIIQDFSPISIKPVTEVAKKMLMALIPFLNVEQQAGFTKYKGKNFKLASNDKTLTSLVKLGLNLLSQLEINVLRMQQLHTIMQTSQISTLVKIRFFLKLKADFQLFFSTFDQLQTKFALAQDQSNEALQLLQLPIILQIKNVLQPFSALQQWCENAEQPGTPLSQQPIVVQLLTVKEKLSELLANVRFVTQHAAIQMIQRFDNIIDAFIHAFQQRNIIAGMQAFLEAKSLVTELATWNDNTLTEITTEVMALMDGQFQTNCTSFIELANQTRESVMTSLSQPLHLKDTLTKAALEKRQALQMDAATLNQLQAELGLSSSLLSTTGTAVSYYDTVTNTAITLSKHIDDAMAAASARLQTTRKIPAPDQLTTLSDASIVAEIKAAVDTMLESDTDDLPPSPPIFHADPDDQTSETPHAKTRL